ncbi:tmcB-like protein [Carpediemonas membranifera]|uniref:TmcB-like protein n=1 Tax=Carpediemonas membranifera TaxID=201153 RepID=A0A8J6E427_9EUKA|nr:tmcB-like protein [Carpediemonas membranifera]|eukprot:KAG9393937.1 tmcB-like protein [Carpediemonas membranifera]
MFLLEIPVGKYRRVMALPADTTDVTALMANRPALPMLLPFQTEIALRSTIRRIRRQQSVIRNIERRVPTSIMEFDGGMTDGGTIDYDLLPEDWREDIAQAKETTQREIDACIRLFQFSRTRWRRSALSTMAYVHFIACFKSRTLTSVINSTSHVFHAPFTAIDAQYFYFICGKYASSLHGDSNAVGQVEAQRNMNTLHRSQRRLTDALASFWTLVEAQKSQKMTLGRLRDFLRHIRRIQSMLTATEKLYARMLKDPTPRVLRSYIQYIRMIYRDDVSAEYVCSLEGQADELEVVRGNEHGAISRRRTAARVPMFDLHRRSANFVSMHTRALGSVVLIAVLFSTAILMVAAALQLCRFISWQLVMASGVATGVQMVGLGLSTLREGSPVTLAAAVQCAGPFWKAVTEELAESYISAALGTYHNFLYVYETEDWTMMQEDPYGTVIAVSESSYTKTINTVIKTLTRRAYNLEDLLISGRINETTFTAGAISSVDEVSIYSFISHAVYAAEDVTFCLQAARASADPHPVLTCTSELTDHLLGIEYTLADTALDGLFEVADSVFQMSQIFPLVELTTFAVIFVIFLASFVVVAGVLYIVPMAQDAMFNAHIIQLFSSVPTTLLDKLILKYERSRSKRAVRKRRLAGFTDAAQGQPVSDFNDSDSDTGGLIDLLGSDPGQPRQSQVQFSSIQLINPDESHDDVESLASPFDSDTTMVWDAGATGSSTDEAPSRHGTRKSSLTSHSVRTGPVKLAGVVEEPEPNLSSGRTRAMRARHIRVSFTIRQLPLLSLWLLTFALLFVALIWYALFQTSDITQTAENIFIQYRSLLLLAHLNQLEAASTWSAADAPMSTATAAALFGTDLTVLGQFVPYLAGLNQDLAIVEEAWADGRQTMKTLATGLTHVMATDNWMAGYNEDEIELLLHSKECLRLHTDACLDTRPVEARQGLLALAQAYLSFADLALAELDDGLTSAPGQAFLNDTAVLSMSGGLYWLQYNMRGRFISQINDTQTNIVLIFAAFVVLLAVFYFIYFFRTIIRMSSIRRQFDLLFQSMTRDEIDDDTLEGLLECFPEMEEL